MKLAKTILICALATASGAFVGATPFDGSTDLGGGNHHSPWFDFYNDQYYPWVYHYDHGWMYCQGAHESSLWLWSEGLGWLWTGSGTYPNVFEANRGWIYYYRGSHNPRWFFDYYPEEVISDAELPPGTTYFPVPEAPETFYWSYRVNNGFPVSGSMDGVAMEFDFTKYDIVFTGHDLVETATMGADVSGTMRVGYQNYPFSGTFGSTASRSFVQDALGIYLKGGQTNLTMPLNIAGDEMMMVSQAGIILQGELQVASPWAGNLYDLPVGTVYRQQVPSGWLNGGYSIEVNGTPMEESTFDYPFQSDIRYELIQKLPTYSLRGRSYTKVVVISVSVLTPDPFGGPATFVDSTVWLAPGVGPIKILEEDPMLNEPAETILYNTNLW